MGMEYIALRNAMGASGVSVYTYVIQYGIKITLNYLEYNTA
jgi:hypothetical protein